MKRHIMSRLSVVVCGAVVTCTACYQAVRLPTYPCLAVQHDRGSAAGRPPRADHNENMAYLGSIVPGGFGGVWTGRQDGRGVDGKTNVSLVDTAQAALARQVLAEEFKSYGKFLQALPPGVSENLHVVRARFDWLQLDSCYGVLTGGGGMIQGVTMSGISASKNKIEIGVMDQTVGVQVWRKVRELKVPVEMVDVIIAPASPPGI
jgi:hypothetical protein